MNNCFAADVRLAVEKRTKKEERAIPFTGNPVGFFAKNIMTREQFNTSRHYQLAEHPDITIQPFGWKENHKDDLNTMPIGKKIWMVAKLFIMIDLPIVILFFVIFMHGLIPSGSMEPLLREGDAMISFRLAYAFEAPRRGDVIVFNPSANPKEVYVKRVIGVEGDTVDLFNGQVYINGCLIKEDYILGSTYPLKEGKTSFTVPENCVFVMGDNRENSSDARAWDQPFIPIEAIKGKTLFRYYRKGEGFKFEWVPAENIEFSDEKYN